MSKYYNEIKQFQAKITQYVKTIFQCYGDELELRLEEYNLLSDKHNCLDSSTAIGYILEEFVVAKLSIFTIGYVLPNDYKIGRGGMQTNKSSFDCLANLNHDILALINIKAQKSTNNAISAINMLHDDYSRNIEQQKCFLVFKIDYKIDTSKRDQKQKIIIKNISSFFLEEVDFSSGFSQDHRNWSKNENLNSGRLQISNAFFRKHSLQIDKISYQNTLQAIKTIFRQNSKKEQK